MSREYRPLVLLVAAPDREPRYGGRLRHAGVAQCGTDVQRHLVKHHRWWIVVAQDASDARRILRGRWMDDAPGYRAECAGKVIAEGFPGEASR